MPALIAIVNIFLLLLAAIFQPDFVHFPTGWHLNGVRPDGTYQIMHVPFYPEPPCSTALNACGDPREPDVALTGRVYCTSGARAIVIDYRTVGCQR